MNMFQISELQYLSTCNRLAYIFVSEKNIDHDFIRKFFEFTLHHLNKQEIDNAIKLARVYEGKNAISHILEVVASINSLVVGEREILKQFKDSYYACREMGLTADALRLVYKKAVTSAKDVFLNTDINKKPVSVVSLAMKSLLEKNPAKSSKVLLVGAGQTIHLVSKFLHKHELKNVTVFNRSLENAQKIAAKFNGKAYLLNELKTYEGGFDIMISCVGTQYPLIDNQIFENLNQGSTAPKIIIDLGVPQNIAPDVQKSPVVEYIAIDQLKALALSNKAFREKEIVKALDIIRDSVDDFYKIYKQRQVELAMKSIPDAIKDVRLRAIDKVFSKEIGELDPDSKILIDKITNYMEKKYIGIPMQVAKQALLTQLDNE